MQRAIILTAISEFNSLELQVDTLPFRNHSASKVTGIENRGKISHFLRRAGELSE